jgi:chromosome segregation ATPase
MLPPVAAVVAAFVAAFVAGSHCLALDQAGLASEFSLPNRPRNLVDTQDEYFDAVQQLQDADAAVVRARESAMREAQTTPDYMAAVKAVDMAFLAFTEKKNALVTELEKTNPVYSQMRSQAAAINAKIEAARQNPDTQPKDFEDLYKDRDTFQKQWQQMESDAMDREKITPLRQQWIDASKKLADMQEKQRAAVDSVEKVKLALADAEEARSKVEAARVAAAHGPATPEVVNNERAAAGDFLRRYSRSGFAGNDAWWTYGWNTIAADAKSQPPAK